MVRCRFFGIGGRYMKKVLFFAVFVIILSIGFAAVLIKPPFAPLRAQTAPQDEVKIPEVIILGQDAKLGQITFNHVSHNGGKYSVDGSGPIACTECHHTAQPASELAKHPPLKTAWPADRETTLTAELYAKDPKGAGVAACRDCHAQTGKTPKLIEKIPEIKSDSGSANITVTNLQAFHRKCTACHVAVVKANKEIKAPTALQCTACHKKAA